MEMEDPPQLLMIVPGEGGIRKSKTIQTVTEEFKAHGIANILVKAAYTGIAACTIGSKTIHTVAMLPVHGGCQSSQTQKKNFLVG